MALVKLSAFPVLAGADSSDGDQLAIVHSGTTSSITAAELAIKMSAKVTAAAGTLTGTTLKNTVVTSSLTSVGTLASVTTTGAATIGTGFGCNSKSAQTAATAGTAPVATASTQTVPFGYATQAQADAIVTVLNNIRAALIANGIMA